MNSHDLKTFTQSPLSSDVQVSKGVFRHLISLSIPKYYLLLSSWLEVELTM